MQDQDATHARAGASPSRSPNPTGGRTLDAAFYEALDRAAAIPDLPEGTDRFTIIRLLSRRGFANSLGWYSGLVAQLHYYISCSKSLDWLPGNLRIVWPQVSKTAAELGISEDTVRTNDRKLMLLGAIAFQDSANYSRYGKRALDDAGRPTGPIVEACGIDIAPCPALLPDIQRKWEAYQAAGKKRKALLRRLSKARRHARNALQQAEQEGTLPPNELEALHSAFGDVEPCRRPDRLPLDDLSAACEAAERFHSDLAARIRAASAHVSSSNIPAQARVKPVPQLHTKENPVQDVVAADGASKPPATRSEPPAAPSGPEGGNGSSRETSCLPEDIKGPSGEQVLKALSPRIAQYLPIDREPSMEEFVTAANYARRDLKISPTLWSRACRNMSPGGASLALAHVAAKWDDGAIEETPGAYFDGILKRALAGKLNLGASLWGMVERNAEGAANGAPETPARPTLSPEPPDEPPGPAAPSSDSSGTTDGPPPPPLFPDDPPLRPSRTVANPVVMNRFCAGIGDPDAMRAVWLRLVRKHGRWPYLDEVRDRHAEIHHPGSAVSFFSMFRTSPGVSAEAAEQDPDTRTDKQQAGHRMREIAEGLPENADPWELIRLLRRPGLAAWIGLGSNPEGPIRLLEYWIGSVDEKEWLAGGRPISTVTPQQTMTDLGLSEAEFQDYAQRLHKIGAFVPAGISISEDSGTPNIPLPAKSPPALGEPPPGQIRGQQRMPPSIREAFALIEKMETMTEAERNAIGPAEIDRWLAATAASRMPVPLARFMPPLGVLDCETVIAATRQALPEFRISPRAWKAFCRQQNEFNAVIAVCLVVNELLEHPGPVPEDLPDRLLKQLSTHKGTTAFFNSRKRKS